MSPDRGGGGGVASSQLSVGHGPVASRNQRRVLLHNMGVCPGRRGSVEGQSSQTGDGGRRTSTPTVVAALTPGRHLQGAGAFGPIGHMAWGAICALLCLGCGSSWVVACTARKVRAGRFCATSGLWLHREGGGGGEAPLASVVVGGVCSVIALAGDCVGGCVVGRYIVQNPPIESGTNKHKQTPTNAE